jgi:hypothetical protein
MGTLRIEEALPRPYPPTEAATPRPRASLLSGGPWRVALAVAGLLAAGVVLSRKLAPPAPSGSAASGARLQLAGSTVLATSVLFDSSISHYRGSFHRRLMFMPPPVAGLTLGAAGYGMKGSGRWRPIRAMIFGLAAVTGAIGSVFHIYNVGKRPGGFRWVNFFYGAPLGAPGALAAAGLMGLCAERARPLLWLADSPRAQTLLCAAGLAGTLAEAALLHYRGAFHNPYMILPLTLPSLAAASATAAALYPTPERHRAASALLTATTLTGGLGVAFHAYGIHRNMAGWANASQNVLNGPPLGAPPGFTGLALFGLGALRQYPLAGPEEAAHD